MARVTGIGGLFFRAKDSKALGAWYDKYFGVAYLQGKDVWRQDAGPTVFSPLKTQPNILAACSSSSW
jgi:glyoxylase I family protein